MNAFVFLNLTKPHYASTSEKVINELKKNKDLNLIFDDNKIFKKENNLTISDAQIIISIGGDGTLLQASKIALEYDLPILGINAGRAGYLCKYNINQLLQDNINILDNIKISNRDVLSAKYNEKEYLALNDFVFSSKNAGYTIETLVKSKNRELKYHASGVIISTPTGSSAYNLAACNCVIDPELKVNIITPICACDANNKSYVIDNNEDIYVSNNRKNDPTDIYCDGGYVGELTNEVIIQKYHKQLKLVV